MEIVEGPLAVQMGWRLWSEGMDKERGFERLVELLKEANGQQVDPKVIRERLMWREQVSYAVLTRRRDRKTDSDLFAWVSTICRSKLAAQHLNSLPTTLSPSWTLRRSVQKMNPKTRRFVLDSFPFSFPRTLAHTSLVSHLQESSLNNITRWADTLHPTSTSSPPTPHEIAQALGTAIELRNSGDEKFKARKLAEAIVDYGRAIDWTEDSLEDEEFADLLARRAITNLRLCELSKNSVSTLRVRIESTSWSDGVPCFAASTMRRELPRSSRVSRDA